MTYSSFVPLYQSRPILVFGRDGQVGKVLQDCLKDLNKPAIFLSRFDCDLSCERSIIDVLNRYQPRVIINAAAYTDVDQAESQRDLAFAVNAKAPELMASYLASVTNGVFVHYSTDYVFADTQQVAYVETDPGGPFDHLNVYGQSKLAGEQAIEAVFRNYHMNHEYCAHGNAKYYILRTSWVYGDGDNFILKILHVVSQSQKIKVVADQMGVPTSAQWLAEQTLRIADSGIQSGIYHVVPDGGTSLYGLATYVLQVSRSHSEAIKIEDNDVLQVRAIDYSTLAKRPYNSRLSNIKLKIMLSKVSVDNQYPIWQEQVEKYVKNYLYKSIRS